MDPRSWERAKDIIADAFAMEPQAREACVRSRCGDDRAFADEILEMLNASPFPSDTLDAPPPYEAPDALADLTPGTRVGPYTIIDRLGRGGMGQVFLASDQELRRKVALKCLLATSANADIERARILSEARAAAAISHPNIAAVYHVVEHGERAFIVMEYVEGESLALRLLRERLAISTVIALGRQFAAALTGAHAQGVIHRDIKPANIQIAVDGSAKVLDFGVASAVRSGSGLHSLGSSIRRSQERGAGPAMVHGGTPPYMSPEQLSGRSVDERSDIFSLGVVLFEMATGCRPYETNEPAALIVAQEQGAPRADAVDARVPAPLADVIAKALEADGAQRWQSAIDVEAALEAVERQLQPAALQGRDLLRRRLARALATLVSCLVAVGSLGFMSTKMFNVVFGRVGPFALFASEPVYANLAWGFSSMFPIAVYMMLTAGLIMLVRFVLRLLSLVGVVAGRIDAARVWAGRISSQIGLDKPAILAQGLSALGLITIAAVLWRYMDLVNAAMHRINLAQATDLVPLRNGNPQRAVYHFVFDILILALSVGLYRVVRLRAQRHMRQGLGAVAVLAGTLALAVILNDLPFRIFWFNEFEKIELAHARCYVIGDHADQELVYCPDGDAPHNRVISSSDPSIHRLGVTESVFTPPARFASAPLKREGQ